jgi:hypothetical protein
VTYPSSRCKRDCHSFTERYFVASSRFTACCNSASNKLPHADLMAYLAHIIVVASNHQHLFRPSDCGSSRLLVGSRTAGCAHAILCHRCRASTASQVAALALYCWAKVVGAQLLLPSLSPMSGNNSQFTAVRDSPIGGAVGGVPPMHTPKLPNQTQSVVSVGSVGRMCWV